jgi:large subunit ribosomal protein L28
MGMAICENCGKKTVVGRSQQHKRGVAGKRWKKRAQATPRVFKPNIQKVTVVIKGEERQMKLCTSCIKRFKKEGRLKSQQIRGLSNLP